MSVVLDTLHYYLVELFQVHGNPRAQTYWIVSRGILHPTLIVGFYFAFVLFLGPLLMRNRKPLELRIPMLAYNLIMSVWNLRFFCVATMLFTKQLSLLDFRRPDTHDARPQTLALIGVGHEYLLSKYVDLLDTIFFVLRKKHSHLGFLHLYHHSLVAHFGSIFFALVPAGPIVGLFALLNSAVHFVMYIFYALAALGPSVRPYLWWKRYITQLQIAQFAILIVYAGFVIRYQEGYPPILIYFGCAQGPVFAYLFVRFYQRTYLAKPKVCAPENANHNNNIAVAKHKIN